MKFAYVDETGSEGGSQDIFVMAGVSIDASKLRKYTEQFDIILDDILSKHPTKKSLKEIKTKRFIDGNDNWGKMPRDERKKIIKDLCVYAKKHAKAKIYAFCLSIKSFETHKSNDPTQTYWQVSGMYLTSLIQKKMVTEGRNKGLTVLIFDEYQKEMVNFSNKLYERNPWYDGLYQKPDKKNKTKWISIPENNRFSQIINTAFTTKSEHSSLIQIADVVAYIYRRHTEIVSGKIEKWPNEKKYYEDLISILKREKLGRTPPGSECVEFYEKIAHPDWNL